MPRPDIPGEEDDKWDIKVLGGNGGSGMIGAMSLGAVFTSYAADGWSKSNDSWTYIYNGQTHTGWLQTSEAGITWTYPRDICPRVLSRLTASGISSAEWSYGHGLD